MPLIKDKDRYKKLTRIDAKQTGQPKKPVNRIINKTLRDRKEASDNIKSEAILDSLDSQNSSPTLEFVKPEADTVTNIITLNKGDSLIELFIYNDAAATLVFNVHWSFSPPEELTFTHSSGKITSVTGGETIGFLKGSFGTGLSASMLILNNTNANLPFFSDPVHLFSNVPKTVYFYFVADRKDANITYSILESKIV
jgi:hypothetical protein